MKCNSALSLGKALQMLFSFFMARQMQKKHQATQKLVNFASVDLEKAIDRVLRDVLRWVLRTLGVGDQRITEYVFFYARSR